MALPIFSIFFLGIVCQSPLFPNSPGLVQLTPGVQLEGKGDSLGQQYSSPGNVVLEKGADVAVVGRGVTRATDPGVAAEKYKNILWDAFNKRIEKWDIPCILEILYIFMIVKKYRFLKYWHFDFISSQFVGCF